MAVSDDGNGRDKQRLFFPPISLSSITLQPLKPFFADIVKNNGIAFLQTTLKKLFRNNEQGEKKTRRKQREILIFVFLYCALSFFTGVAFALTLIWFNLSVGFSFLGAGQSNLMVIEA